MCGRFTAKLTWHQLHDLYEITAPEVGSQAEFDLKPRYNVAPSQKIPVVRLDKDGQRELAMLRWGLIPSWANDPKVGYKMINARGETVATAPPRRFQAPSLPNPVDWLL